MRYLVISILFVLAFCSCQKEDELTNELDFSNVFEITNDPNDAVQSARYEIYKNYNVSVYFNDTVGRQLIRNDINGNPYYRYETLDMPWTFFDENSAESNVTYRYFYTEGTERQLKALERIVAFLESLDEKMYPKIIMAVDSAYLVRNDGVVTAVLGSSEVIKDVWGNLSVMHNPDFRTNFRYMLLTSLADIDDLRSDEYFLSITKDLAMDKIVNYGDKLANFGNITPDDYNKDDIFVYPTDDEMEAKWETELPFLVGSYGVQTLGYGRPHSFFELGYEERLIGLGATTEFVEDSKAIYASIIGSKGFVKPKGTASGVDMRNSPATVNDDIVAFTELALLYTPEEVQYYWGKYPLVMQKYNIIKDILVNDMGIDLERE